MQIVRFQIPLTHKDSGFCSENVSLRWGPWTRLGTTSGLQYLLHCKNVRFKNEEAILQGVMLSGRLVAAIVTMVQNGLAFGAELESEFCFACICPAPHGHLSNATHDVGRLIHVEVTGLFVAVRFGLLHPETERYFQEDFKDKWGGPDRGFHTGPHSQADGWFGEESEVA